MRKATTATLVFCSMLMLVTEVNGWSKQDDIPIASLPAAVKAVVETYAKILKESKTLDEATLAFGDIAGGSLVTESGSISSNTKQFGLKKDFNNFKHYAYPVKITRVNKTVSNGDGYGAQRIAGDRYTVWIAKNDPAKGMPAPVTIIAPASGAPRVVNVGSY
ncbi:MAG: hypothetical protein HS115_18865 [Spirochaetales bacterium]|nr:hypothetical protein [Spirochaetales bacterium]